METFLGMAVMAAVPAYFVMQPLALRSWRGGWHLAAALPLLLVVPALVFSLVAFAGGSNLWPLMLIFAAALGAVYLGLLWLAQWWFA
jgi:hypothetical protein